MSLPFSDHCEPLIADPEESRLIWATLEQESKGNNAWKYVEIRPLRQRSSQTSFHHSSHDYAFHRLDLSPGLAELFSAFHKDSTQRKIRRAEREGLKCEEGRSDFLLSIFYRLLILTRRRHGVPPQPFLWFRNLIDCLGEAVQIRVAFKGAQPVAAIFTTRYNGTLLYKYGATDARFHNLGGIHLLLWKSIEEAKGAGLYTFELGRSDADNAGLIRFKDQWGAIRSCITYSRYAASPRHGYKPSRTLLKLRFTKQMLKHFPVQLLSMAGGILYKHVG